MPGSRPTAAVVGTGFVGLVHVEALRRLGVGIAGLLGSSPERARTKAEPLGLGVYTSLEELLEDPAVDVVHLATPNHLHHAHAKAALAAGKHVVCEKPLGLDSAQTAELVALAEASGLVHCTNLNLRFYPLVQEARTRVAAGTVGEVWSVHGSYLQDWLALPTDWNWRLDPARGGRPRAVGDIGSHWLDLAELLTGRRIESLVADLHTAIPVRQRPAGPVETFAAATGEREPVALDTDDLAHVLLRFEGGARGAVVLSQVSSGRRNRIQLEIDGSEGALAWDSDRGEELWLGHRGRPNELLPRDPALLEGPVRGSLPAGHGQGYADTFVDLYRAVYAAVEAGAPGDGYPTFRDGHRSAVLAEAIARSSRDRAWVDVP